MNIINAKIDVSKIDKNRLYKGQKGTYLNCVLIPTPKSEYGDYMIVEQTSKEEREKDIKGNILGNAKEFKKDPVSTKEKEDIDNFNDVDDLPF